MCNCVILDVTVKKILITAFLKKLPFLAKDRPFSLEWCISEYYSVAETSQITYLSRADLSGMGV